MCVTLRTILAQLNCSNMQTGTSDFESIVGALYPAETSEERARALLHKRNTMCQLNESIRVLRTEIRERSWRLEHVRKAHLARDFAQCNETERIKVEAAIAREYGSINEREAEMNALNELFQRLYNELNM